METIINKVIWAIIGIFIITVLALQTYAEIFGTRA